MFDLNDIRFRLKNAVSITSDELIYLLNNDSEGLLDFMLLNNPASINNMFKYHFGLSFLPFQPDIKQLQAQIDYIIEHGDVEKARYIVNYFKYNSGATNWTYEDGLDQKLSTIFPNWFS